MTIKSLKFFFFLSFFFLNGCIQATAFLGPGITVATTGNAMHAGFQYGTNKAIKKKQEKIPMNIYKTLRVISMKIKN